MIRWIGLAGKMGAGKDHTFLFLRDMGYPVVRVSFADGLRKEVEETLGLDEPFTKPYTDLERRLLQWWGTDYRRSTNPNYWVEIARDQAFLAQEHGYPVFTDVRFPNEADMIRENGGLIVRLSASASTRKVRLGLKQNPPEHESETALDHYRSDVWIPTDISDHQYKRDVRWLAKRAGYEETQ